MSRYKLFTDKLANILTHPTKRGRGNVLWLQAMLKPLQRSNDEFQSFVFDKKLEASVSFQVIHFGWYLNYKLRQYFANDTDEIKFAHYVDLGVPIYDDGENGEVPFLVWGEEEEVAWQSRPEEQQPQPLYHEFESLSAIGASFRVSVPPILIPDDEFGVILKAEIEKYRTAGKTYVIEYITQ